MKTLPLILSLFDFTGEWSKPYKDAGYTVQRVDIKLGYDIFKFSPPKGVHGILAAPPCTHFSVAGSRFWKQKDEDGRTEDALALVDRVLWIIEEAAPAWWALENPKGRLGKLRLGIPRLIFNPHEYAGWADDPYMEAYTKATCLWGTFTVPQRNDVGNQLGSYTNQMFGGKSKRTKALRSITPQGFARAFFAANP